jgi:hypothetical protein
VERLERWLERRERCPVEDDTRLWTLRTPTRGADAVYSDMNKVYGFEGEVKAKLGEMTYKLFADVFTSREC